MKQTKQFLRPLLMAIVMLVGMLVPQGAWAQYLEVWEEETISSDASYDEIEVYPGGVLIINEGVTLTVTSGLNIHDINQDGNVTVINYGTIIGEGHLGMDGGVLANHGHIDLSGAGGIGTYTFYNTGTLGENIDLTPTEECNHAWYENLGTVKATCTHGDGTQKRCYMCYYMWLDETSGALPHSFNSHNGMNICSSCGHTTYDAPTVGIGTAESPYQIANAGHLFWFADKVNNDYENFQDANAVLTADIVVNDGTFAADGTFTATGASEPSTPIEWLIIGRFEKYRGIFDGQGHTISGLYANYEDSGLVGSSAGECKIKNVGVINSYFASIDNVGGICGYAGNNTEISNCYSSNVICKGNYVGGILGWAANNDVSIVNCYSTASLIGAEDWAHFGGIASQSGSTTNCYTSYEYVNEWSKSEINCEANVSLERFASGEIAYKLNGSIDGEGSWTAGATDGTQKWYQTIGTDAAPVFVSNGSNTVYEQKTIDCGGTVVACNYNNTEEEDVTQPHDFTSHTLTASPVEDGLYAYACDNGCGQGDEHRFIKDFNGVGNHLELTKDGEGNYSTSEDITLADANGFVSPVDFTAASVTYNRNIEMDDGMYSFIVPFDIPADQAAELGTFYQYSKHEEGNVYFDNADGIVRANNAYFFKPAKDITSITVENPTFGTTDNMADATNPSEPGLYGTYSQIDIPVGAYGYGYMGFFVKAGTGNKIKPFRAYLWLGSGASMAKALAFFGDYDDITGINNIETDTDLDMSKPIYTLSGQRIMTPKKGEIYIQNGKKVIKK